MQHRKNKVSKYETPSIVKHSSLKNITLCLSLPNERHKPHDDKHDHRDHGRH
jgi:hypothetical protein